MGLELILKPSALAILVLLKHGSARTSNAQHSRLLLLIVLSMNLPVLMISHHLVVTLVPSTAALVAVTDLRHGAYFISLS